MWKVLIPIILLVVALLFQLQVRESFTTTTTDASGNPTDASGNVTKPASSTITLSLADLLSLFKASAGAGTGTTTSGTTTGGTTSTMFYTTTTTTPPTTASSATAGSAAGAGSTVDGVSSSNLSGSPYEPSLPIPSEAPCSDAAAQGVEFQNALQDYIKKDEIPCYGCTL